MPEAEAAVGCRYARSKHLGPKGQGARSVGVGAEGGIPLPQGENLRKLTQKNAFGVFLNTFSKVLQ